MDQVNAGQGTVGKLLKDDNALPRDHRLHDEPEGDPAEDQPGQGTVGKLVNDQEFYKNAKLTLQKLDKATEGLEDQGPLSVWASRSTSYSEPGASGRGHFSIVLVVILVLVLVLPAVFEREHEDDDEGDGEMSALRSCYLSAYRALK